MFTRTRTQDGCLQRKSRGHGEEVWEFRYYDTDTLGQRTRKTVTVGSVREYLTESAARRSPIVQSLLLRVNIDQPSAAVVVPAFGAVLARYESEEMPERYSTRSAYQSNIKTHIRPRWADTPIDRIKAMAVEDWLKSLPLAPKTKSHIRGLMHTIFECARRWEVAEKNPIELVRVKGGTKRTIRPIVLSPEQFQDLLPRIPEPYRTMVLVAGCLGLRVSEILGLQWRDFDFNDLTVLVQRAVVGKYGDTVKTEYSEDHVPLDPALAQALDAYRERSHPTEEGWLFANPKTGRPYHRDNIQKRYLIPAGVEAKVAGKLGWHSFRHSYRSWLDDIGAPMSVQKELMRHASIQTTMNVYGRAMTDTKRQANSKVVEMVIRRETLEGAPTVESREGRGLAANGS